MEYVARAGQISLKHSYGWILLDINIMLQTDNKEWNCYCLLSVALDI
jgi:hypothetical protein